MAETALILGATGRFGRNVALQFENSGWNIRRFDRHRDDLDVAATGADVIVNGWNPAYPDWQRQIPELTARVIAAAKRTGATVLIPGNVYVFGAQSAAPWSQDTPHRAENPLGRIRIEMEAAYRASGVRTILLRGGDFIDTEASGNWFDLIMIKSLAKGVFTYPGNPEIPHAWAYLPDFTRAAVSLAEMRDQLPVYADIPFPGYTLTGRDLAAALEEVVGRNVRLKRMSWLPLHLSRPFWRMAGCLLEMRYLWSTPHSLDPALFHRLLPEFRATPLQQALAEAIPQASVRRQVDPDQTVTTGG